MFNKAAAAEPASDVIVPPEQPVPLSVLELDLPTPVEGWTFLLAARGVEITLDDIGRMSIAVLIVRVLPHMSFSVRPDV
jgi:hypothetical protein